MVSKNRKSTAAPPTQLADLYDVKGGHFRQVRPLRSGEYDAYHAAVRHLSEFRRWRQLIRMANQNAQEFQGALSSAAAVLSESKLLTDARDEIDFSANHRLLNFLSTMRLFLDHTETRLKRRYGTDSPPLQAFKARTATAYDGVFGYRFLYRLRNYGQHCAVPIGHVQVESHLVNPPNPTLKERRVTLGFDTSELLAYGGDTWGPTLRVELENSPPILDVAPLVEDVRHELQGVQSVVEDAEKPELLKISKPIIDTVTEVVEARGIPMVRLLNAEQKQIDLVQLPYDILAWLGHKLPQLTF